MITSTEPATSGPGWNRTDGSERRNHIVPLLLVVGLLLGACSSSGVSDQPAGDGALPVTSEAVVSPGSATIEIAGFDFGDPVTVRPGDTVTVVNTDPASHTWTAEGGEWDSGNLAQSDSFDFTFSDPGEYAFFCRIHPTMTGRVIVEG